MASASFHPFLLVMISGKMFDIKMLHVIFENGRLPLDIRIKCAISHAVLGNAGGMHTSGRKGEVVRSVFRAGDFSVGLRFAAEWGKRYA